MKYRHPPQARWLRPTTSAALKLELALTAAVLVAAWLTERTVPPQIPLHYSRPWGDTQLAPRHALWWLAGGVTLIAAANLTLASKLSSKDQLLGQLVVFATLAITSLVLIAVITVWARVG